MMLTLKVTYFEKNINWELCFIFLSRWWLKCKIIINKWEWGKGNEWNKIYFIDEMVEQKKKELGYLFNSKW